LRIAITASALGSAFFNLVVYSGGATDANIVERFSDITMDKTSAYYAINVINGGSAYISAADQNVSDTFNDTDNPAVTAVTALSSGSNGTAPSTANIASAISAGALDSIDSALLLNAPGLTAQADVDVLLAYAAGRKDVFVVIDGINDTASAQITLVNTYATTNAAYGAVYYPQLVIPNPAQVSTGATVTVPAGAAVMGRIITTDASRGVFKSPAGLEARLTGVVSVAKLTNTELDNLNSNAAAINAIRYIPGSGIVVMGARTLKPGYNDRYVSVRRSLIYLRKQMDDITKFALFESNDFRLWNRIETTLQAFLTDFWQQGGLSGNTPSDAFFVKCDDENNTTLTVANGEVIAEVGVALQRPAEFIVIRISQYDGGAVVTVS
jgi:phage tail sheath protein FI